MSLTRFNSRPRTTGDRSRPACSAQAGFQFTPAHDGRPARSMSEKALIKFQFTPAHDGRPSGATFARWHQGFNSRPRTTGDRRRARVAPAQRRFNSRPRTTGDRVPTRLSVTVCGFNSRPRTTGDPPRGGRRPEFRVSIHARARRATECVSDFSALLAFQFTPAHDGRPSSPTNTPRSGGFNSRPRTTGDGAPLVVTADEPVSIHARARRATRGRARASRAAGFQFTPAHDGRPPEQEYVESRMVAARGPPRCMSRQALGTSDLRVFQRPCGIQGFASIANPPATEPAL